MTGAAPAILVFRTELANRHPQDLTASHSTNPSIAPLRSIPWAAVGRPGEPVERSDIHLSQ